MDGGRCWASRRLANLVVGSDVVFHTPLPDLGVLGKVGHDLFDGTSDDGGQIDFLRVVFVGSI